MSHGIGQGGRESPAHESQVSGAARPPTSPHPNPGQPVSSSAHRPIWTQKGQTPKPPGPASVRGGPDEERSRVLKGDSEGKCLRDWGDSMYSTHPSNVRLACWPFKKTPTDHVCEVNYLGGHGRVRGFPSCQAYPRSCQLRRLC